MTRVWATVALSLITMGCDADGDSLDKTRPDDAGTDAATGGASNVGGAGGSGGSSSCPTGTMPCGTECVDPATDPQNCGACGLACPTASACEAGSCTASCVDVLCNGQCVDLQTDPAHCGACDTACNGDSLCVNGACVSTCQAGFSKCSAACVDLSKDEKNCGACGNVCPAGQNCVNGSCLPCPGDTTDCDGDGWSEAEGDCCDQKGCANDPELVNPGAYEVVGNGLDDDCNGGSDFPDALPCDLSLDSGSNGALDYAKAMDICRVTTDNPTSKAAKTWGVISAQLLRADGSPLADSRAKSIRSKFGSHISALKGSRFAVLSTGIAADATQTNPGPNGGAPAGANVSTAHNPSSSVGITNGAVGDWLAAANPPLKPSGGFPKSATCSASVDTSQAFDSVMLELRVRVPTNARGFTLYADLLTAEYPERICSSFDDQALVLVDTSLAGSPFYPNPPDENVLRLQQLPGVFLPLGMNVLAQTDAFAVCDPAALGVAHPCHDPEIGGQSCLLGAGDLAGTGFDTPLAPGACNIGAGTYWFQAAGGVVPGGIATLRFVIFDTGDALGDSLLLLDGFEWHWSLGPVPT